VELLDRLRLQYETTAITRADTSGCRPYIIVF
jgi:hypothetical protein